MDPENEKSTETPAGDAGSAGPEKGRRKFWIAFGFWCVAACMLTGEVLVALIADGFSWGGLLAHGWLAFLFLSSIPFLYRGDEFARYFAGAVALVGVLVSLPAVCSPGSGFPGARLVDLATAGLCVYVWHAYLIDSRVAAYHRTLGLVREG